MESMQSWIFSCWNWRMMAVEGTDGNEMMEIQGVAICRVGCTNSVFCNLSIKIFVWKHIRANDEFVFFFCSYKAFRAFFFTFFLFFYCSRFVSFFFWKYWIYFQLLYWITSIILVFFFQNIARLFLFIQYSTAISK